MKKIHWYEFVQDDSRFCFFFYSSFSPNCASTFYIKRQEKKFYINIWSYKYFIEKLEEKLSKMMTTVFMNSAFVLYKNIIIYN